MRSQYAISPGIFFTSSSVFLFSAIALTVSSGYTLGALLLFLGSIPLLIQPRFWPELTSDDKKVLLVLGLFAAVWILEVLLTDQGSRELDKPSRFLMAMGALILLLRFPPKAAFLWSGIALGAIGSGLIASWQTFFLGMVRAEGHTNSIQFGNISMLFGLLCLASIGWCLSQAHHKNKWLMLMGLGFIAGFLGSILSGSRGGWIGLPFTALVLYKSFQPWINKKLLVTLIAASLLLITLIYGVPQTGVQMRIKQAISNIETYQDGNANTSVGLRFEMWKGATLLFLEKPLTGWSEPGYQAKMNELADQKIITDNARRFGHAHNEYLDVAAKRGIVGLIVLLLMYLWPIRLFLNITQAQDLKIRSYQAAGSLLCVAYIDFSLTQAFLSHNSGVMIFAFMLVILWSITRYEVSHHA